MAKFALLLLLLPSEKACQETLRERNRCWGGPHSIRDELVNFSGSDDVDDPVAASPAVMLFVNINALTVK